MSQERNYGKYIAGGTAVIVLGGLALALHLTNQPDNSRQIHLVRTPTDSDQDSRAPTRYSYALPHLVSPIASLEDRELQRMIGDALGINPNSLTSRPISPSEARQNFLVGVALEREFHSQGPIFPEPEGSTITIKGIPYNLDHPDDFLFANASLQGALRRFYNHPFWGERPPNSVMEDIAGLRGKLFILNASTHPVVDATMLADLNKGLETLTKAGKKVPDRAIMVNNFSSAEDGNVLTLAETGNAFYFLGQYYLRQEPALMKEFTKTWNLQKSLPINNHWLTRANIDMPRSLTIDDDFVGTFREYLENGNNFRRRILYAETLGNHAEAQVLQAKYDVFHEWLGTDIAFKAYPKDLRDYRPDEVAWIEDAEEVYDSADFGIYLRPEPRLDIDPNWPNVRNGFAVKILEGPKVVIDFERDQAMRMYKVQSGYTVRLSDGKTAFVADPDSQGWMLDDYLGTTAT